MGGVDLTMLVPSGWTPDTEGGRVAHGRRPATVLLLVVGLTVACGCGQGVATATPPLAAATAPTLPQSSDAPTASPGACPGAVSLPASVATAGSPSFRLTFVQSGCSVGISSVQIIANAVVLRTTLFNPPLAAGDLDPADLRTSFEGAGTFQGQSVVDQPGGDHLVFNEQGSYTARATVLLKTPVGGSFEQWASSAVASSQYGADNWSAGQATGPPNSLVFGDDQTAWAPATKDGGSEWLELTYPEAVSPSAVRIWENDGAGAVTRVEAYDPGSASWLTLWSGTDPTKPGATTVFSPPIAPTAAPTSRIRLTIDTSVPEWNEIDAVGLVGATQTPGFLVWLRGQWTETGTRTECLADRCVASSWTDQPPGEWSLAFNTATGKVGTSPKQVK